MVEELKSILPKLRFAETLQVMAKKLKANQRNEFAASKLKTLLENYKKFDDTQRVREEAKVLIRQFGDEMLLGQFRNNSKARYGTPEVEMDKLRTAIGVAITHFENMDMFDSLVDVQDSGSWTKVYAYLFLFMVVFILVLVMNNYSLINQINFGIKQWLIIALAPIVFLVVSFWKNKIGERWFAVFLVVLTILLERLLPQF